MAHTPGPWRAVGRDVIVDYDTAVAHAFGGGAAYPEQAANARLIAAAPDMLAALEPFAACAAPFGETWKDDDELLCERHGHLLFAVTVGQLRRAHAAIAKATGNGR